MKYMTALSAATPYEMHCQQEEWLWQLFIRLIAVTWFDADWTVVTGRYSNDILCRTRVNSSVRILSSSYDQQRRRSMTVQTWLFVIILLYRLNAITEYDKRELTTNGLCLQCKTQTLCFKGERTLTPPRQICRQFCVNATTGPTPNREATLPLCQPRGCANEDNRTA